MARCGCNAASATTCDAIVLCVAANLGPGLRYDTVTGLLAVRLSGDAGNDASFGSDGGIYVPGDGAIPDPASGRKTIAGLPERAFGANATGGGAMLPIGSPDGLDYGIANRLDILNISVHGLSDGIALVRWLNPTAPLNLRTDNPSSIECRLISSVTLPSLLLDAGARTTPTGRNSGAPASLLSPDGGWFGFYARSYTPVTVSDALHQVAARAVVYLAVYANMVEAEVASYIAGAMNAVLQAGAQAWTFVGVAGYVDDGAGNSVPAPFADWVGDVLAAGMTPAVDLFDDQSGGFTVTPAEVVASGADWVRFGADETSNGTSYARIQEFVDAGLQVIVQVRSARHWDVDQAYAIGARAVSSDNPVYSRGARGETGDLAYRKTTVIPGLITRTMMEGALTHLTNEGTSVEDIGWARQNSDGRNFSAGFGRVGGVGFRLTSQLLGELCPYEATSAHTLRVRFRLDPTQVGYPSGFVPKIGIFVAAPNDRDITSAFDGLAPEFNPWVNGYWAYIGVGQTQQGVVTLAKINNGVMTILADSGSFPSVAIGEWVNMAITLSATQVTLVTSHSTDPDDIVYTVDDTDHRGTYAFYTWEDDYQEPITNPGFVHGYSAFTTFQTTGPMYEDVS